MEGSPKVSEQALEPTRQLAKLQEKSPIIHSGENQSPGLAETVRTKQGPVLRCQGNSTDLSRCGTNAPITQRRSRPDEPSSTRVLRLPLESLGILSFQGATQGCPTADSGVGGRYRTHGSISS